MIEDSAGLRARIFQEVEHHLTPQAISDVILDDVSDAELALIARLAFPGYVREVITGPLRRQAPRDDQVRNEPTKSTGKVKTYASADGRKFASPQLAARHDWYERQMNVPLKVDGNRKRFGDFTLDDLGWLVRYRERQADELHGQAKKYQRIAELLKTEGAATVRDLDPALVEPLLNG
jgi:hypothetical protein